ncbi:hypothetical protein [Parasitella parasitica]|uniref:F-box domain-containing protein n=1 Tax=Parasitella parasitica TaxID=35722 RepID=A0A0B7N4A8_9FUNG|nr:hypothetical protein [Parasitella parasitica]
MSNTSKDENASTSLNIRRLNKLIQQHYAEKSSKFYRVFPFVLPYIDYNDITTCALINSSYSHFVKDRLWSDPRFEKIAYTHDALYVFNKFLSQLPSIQPRATQIHKLDLKQIQETLYDRVNPKFLQIIIQYCTNLNALDFEKVEFLSAKSLPKEPWTLPHLTHLNLSYCPHVNDDIIVTIARSCRKLIRVKLDGLDRHKGRGLAGLAAECDQLSSISVKYNTAMEDQAIIALAKFRHIRLLELDLTGCTKLTSTGLAMLARYAAHLTNLSVARTNCRFEELAKFSCIQRFTETLDISGLKQIQNNFLANWIWQSRYQQLRNLTMEATTAIALVKLSQQPQYLLDTSILHVAKLKLTNLPEHTPMSYLYQLTNLFPRLTHITFVRAYFETDFMHGMYRPPSPESESCITDAQLAKFNVIQKQITAIVIREREDNVDFSLSNW